MPTPISIQLDTDQLVQLLHYGLVIAPAASPPAPAGTVVEVTLPTLPGTISKLILDLPSTRPLRAGTSYPSIVRFADIMNQTVPFGVGPITIQESGGGTTQVVSVTSNGYASVNITPTRVGEINWELTSGQFTGVSETKSVIAGPFASFSLSAIPNQTARTHFSISVQAEDAYGNLALDVGANKKLVIRAEPGFPADSVVPNYAMLVDGAITVSVTCMAAGRGALLVVLGEISAMSNTFTVS